MTDKEHEKMMQRSALQESEEWAMSERREKAVMRGMSNIAPVTKAKPFDDGEYRFPSPRGVLSKAEIEALLRPELPIVNEADKPVLADVRPPEFAEPKTRPGAEARRIAARLALLLGHTAGVKASITSRTADTLVVSAPDAIASAAEPGMAFVCYGHDETDISHVLCLPAGLVDTLICNACGGEPGQYADTGGRALSAIDCALIEQLAMPLPKAFDPQARLIGVETTPAYVASLLPGESGEAFRFDMQLETGSVCATLIRVRDAKPVASSAEQASDVGKKPMTVVMTARIATLSVPVSRLSTLKPGDTLLLGIPADQPVELLSGGRDGIPAFEGDIGRKGANMAIRVTRRCPT